MEQNANNKLMNSLKAAVFVLSAGLLFLNFGILPKVKAACNYSATLTPSATSVTTSGQVTLHLNFNVSTTGNTIANDCGNKVNVSYQYKITKGLFSSGSYHVMDTETYTINQGKAGGDYTVNLKNDYSSIKSDLSDPNSIIFGAYASALGGSGEGARASDVTVAVSGAAGDSSGNISLKFEPFKSQYSAGDTFTIDAFATTFNFDSSVQNIYVSYKVNKIEVASKTVGRQSLFDGVISDPITVNSASHFNSNAASTIRVEVWAAGTNSQLAFAENSVQAGDLGGSGNIANTNPGSVNATNTNPGSDIANTNPGSSPSSTASINCSGSNPDPNNCFYNPLPVDSLTAVLLLIMKGFLGIIAVWAVAFIVIGGFRMVMSQGNEEAVTAAKKTITWAVIGLVVAALSFSIIAIVQNLLQTQVKDVSTKTSISSWKILD